MDVWQHYKLSTHYLSRYQAMARISRTDGLTKTQRYDYAALFAKHLEHWRKTLVTIEWPCPCSDCKYDNETSYSLFGRHIERPTCERCGESFPWVSVLEASYHSWAKEARGKAAEVGRILEIERKRTASYEETE